MTTLPFSAIENQQFSVAILLRFANRENQLTV
jgi:hypothetical protein